MNPSSRRAPSSARSRAYSGSRVIQGSFRGGLPVVQVRFGADRRGSKAVQAKRPGVEAFPVDLRPKTGGQPLPAEVQAKMESALGADFSDVRIHVGREAASVGAIAFTWGSDIHFAPGQYSPHTTQGQRLLGHELTHVVQQRAGRVSNPFGSGVAVVQDRALEAEADRIGAKIAMALTPSARAGAVQPKLSHTIQRNPANPNTPEASIRAQARWGKIRSEVAKMGHFNRTVGSPATGTPAQSGPGPAFSPTNKTTTPGSAWMANQMGRKDIIGSVDEYMGRADDPGSKHFEHLAKFRGGAHAFVTPLWHNRIQGEGEGAVDWVKGWGRDSNFVAPLSDANALVRRLSGPDAGGLFELEEILGVPSGQWVGECKATNYGIYRYIIKKPQAFGIRAPSGSEGGAYGSWWNKDKFVYGEWTPGGMTSGGNAEALIDALPRKELKKAMGYSIDIQLDHSLARQTLAVIAAGGWVAWKQGSRPAHARSLIADWEARK